jgi:hypothetical protein
MREEQAHDESARLLATDIAMKFSIAALLFMICACVAISPIPAGASGAPRQSSWNGTWVGNWTNGDGAQIIFAGDEFIGLYWRGDYLSDAHAAVSPAGIVTISWPSGSATLTRDGDTTAHIVIHEPGKTDTSFALKRET